MLTIAHHTILPGQYCSVVPYSPVPSAIKLLLLYSVNSTQVSSFVRPHAIKFSLPMTFLTWYILSDSPLFLIFCSHVGRSWEWGYMKMHFCETLFLWCNKHTNNFVYTYWMWIWIKIFLKDYFQFFRIWLLCICRGLAKRYWPLFQNCKLQKANFDTCFFLIICWNLCKQNMYACKPGRKEMENGD